QAEGEKNGFLQPLVYRPGAVVAAFGNTDLAAVEQVQRGLDRIANFAAGGRADAVAFFERALYGGGQGGGIGRTHRNSLNFDAYFRLSGCRKVDFIELGTALEQVPRKMKPLLAG